VTLTVSTSVSLPVPVSEPRTAVAGAPLHPRPVSTLATLGDSTTVGLGDPAAGGGWRGFPKLLQAALGAATLLNPARTGARMRAVLHEQVPLVVAARPEVAVVFVGMNDTLRSDFDPVAMSADGAAVIGALHAVGARVLLVRYHDHTRVFHLPAPLRRALLRRIAQLNAVMDGLAVAEGVDLLDLAALPGVYDRSAWAVDRLHPSELGHRMLAGGFAALLADAGFAVPHPVGEQCAGGREITAAHRFAWLVVKGIPWLVKRGSDLGPVIVQGLVDELGRSRSGSRA
jgi:lysophospholipase L1-like esterase